MMTMLCSSSLCRYLVSLQVYLDFSVSDGVFISEVGFMLPRMAELVKNIIEETNYI
jgi:hypothetical protein